jgi:hypothetical protein
MMWFVALVIWVGRFGLISAMTFTSVDDVVPRCSSSKYLQIDTGLCPMIRWAPANMYPAANFTVYMRALIIYGSDPSFFRRIIITGLL